VLVDTKTQASELEMAVVGVGLNLNQALEDFPEDLRSVATSLWLAKDRTFSKQAVLKAFLRELVTSGASSSKRATVRFSRPTGRQPAGRRRSSRLWSPASGRGPLASSSPVGFALKWKMEAFSWHGTSATS